MVPKRFINNSSWANIQFLVLSRYLYGNRPNPIPSFHSSFPGVTKRSFLIESVNGWCPIPTWSCAPCIQTTMLLCGGAEFGGICYKSRTETIWNYHWKSARAYLFFHPLPPLSKADQGLPLSSTEPLVLCFDMFLLKCNAGLKSYVVLSNWLTTVWGNLIRSGHNADPVMAEASTQCPLLLWDAVKKSARGAKADAECSFVFS